MRTIISRLAQIKKRKHCFGWRSNVYATDNRICSKIKGKAKSLFLNTKGLIGMLKFLSVRLSCLLYIIKSAHNVTPAMDQCVPNGTCFFPNSSTHANTIPTTKRQPLVVPMSAMTVPMTVDLIQFVPTPVKVRFHQPTFVPPNSYC